MNPSDENDRGRGADDFWYFGYGPMVHPSVRQRRDINVMDEQPAVLPDHRLTFAFGGVASIMRKRGFDVHGILMRCCTESDWEKLRGQESGYFPTSLEVYPYGKSLLTRKESPELDDSDSQVIETPPVRAYAFVMNDFEEKTAAADSLTEKLPHERYLKLIAAGMSKYSVEEDYVNDEILGVPFTPDRKPHEYLTFPRWPGFPVDTDLPKMSYKRYQKYCQKSNKAQLCFISGKHLILCAPHDIKHAGSIWFREHGFGKPDVSCHLQTCIVNPSLPYCRTPDEMTPAVQAWAENQMCISMAQGLTAHRVAVIVDGPSQESRNIGQLWKSILAQNQSITHTSGGEERRRLPRSEAEGSSRSPPHHKVFQFFSGGSRRKDRNRCP